MWWIQPKKDYTKSSHWKHDDQTSLYSWQIRTRPYNTKVANIGGFISTIFVTLLMIPFVKGMLGGPISGFFLLVFFFFLLSIPLSGTHQTTIIVYRLTENLGEVFSWKPQIDAIKPLMKWSAIISAFPVAWIILSDPGAILIAAGPLGMGVMAFAMGNSSEYQKQQREESHFEIDFNTARKIVAYDKRRIIGVQDQYCSENNSFTPLFCTKDNYENLKNYFSEQYQDIFEEVSQLKVYRNSEVKTKNFT